MSTPATFNLGESPWRRVESCDTAFIVVNGNDAMLNEFFCIECHSSETKCGSRVLFPFLDFKVKPHMIADDYTTGQN